MRKDLETTITRGNGGGAYVEAFTGGDCVFAGEWSIEGRGDIITDELSEEESDELFLKAKDWLNTQMNQS